MSKKPPSNIIYLPTDDDVAPGIAACLRRLREEALQADLPLTAHLIDTAIDAIRAETLSDPLLPIRKLHRSRQDRGK